MESIARLAQSIRALAQQRDKEKVRVGLLEYAPLLKAMADTGYLPEEDGFGMWVMEKKLDSAIVG